MERRFPVLPACGSERFVRVPRAFRRGWATEVRALQAPGGSGVQFGDQRVQGRILDAPFTQGGLGVEGVFAIAASTAGAFAQPAQHWYGATNRSVADTS